MRQSLVLCLSVVLFVSGCRTCGSKRFVTIDRPNCQCHVAATDVSSGQKTTAIVAAPVRSNAIVGKFNEFEATDSVLLPPSKFEIANPLATPQRFIDGQMVSQQRLAPVEPTEADHWTESQTVSPRDPARETIAVDDSNRRDASQMVDVANTVPIDSKDDSSFDLAREDNETRLEPIKVAEVEVAEVESPAPVQNRNDEETDEGNSFAAQPSLSSSKESPAVLPEPNEEELNTIFENNDAAEEILLPSDSMEAETPDEPTLDPWTAESSQPLASILEESSTTSTESDEPILDTLQLTSPSNDQPVVLYARPTQHHTPARSRFENLKSEVTAEAVGSAMILSTFPAESATSQSTDARFGLPTTDDVEFTSLPSLDDGSTTEVARLQNEIAHAQQMMLVVYRDEDGRLFLAPPATHVAPDSQRLGEEQDSNSVTSRGGDPVAPAKQYYLPPKPILRLKATTPIGQPTKHPSVARIMMRDTVIVDGTHLLAMPELKAKKEHIGQLSSDGSPKIDYKKLREAIRRLTPSDQEKLR